MSDISDLGAEVEAVRGAIGSRQWKEHDVAPKAVAALADQLRAGKKGQESECEFCRVQNPVWFAPNELWNLVVGGPDAKGDPGGFMCPCCFMRLAESKGVVPTAWVVAPEVNSNDRISYLEAENAKLREEVDASWKEIRRSHRLQITNCNCSVCEALVATEARDAG